MAILASPTSRRLNNGAPGCYRFDRAKAELPHLRSFIGHHPSPDHRTSEFTVPIWLLIERQSVQKRRERDLWLEPPPTSYPPPVARIPQPWSIRGGRAQN